MQLNATPIKPPVLYRAPLIIKSPARQLNVTPAKMTVLNIGVAKGKQSSF